MKRTTIMIPEDLKVRAFNRANMMGISLGGFIRESLERALDRSNDDQSVDDPFFADDAVFQGETPSDLGKNHDRYLYGDVTV